MSIGEAESPYVEDPDFVPNDADLDHFRDTTGTGSPETDRHTEMVAEILDKANADHADKDDRHDGEVKNVGKDDGSTKRQKS